MTRWIVRLEAAALDVAGNPARRSGDIAVWTGPGALDLLERGVGNEALRFARDGFRRPDCAFVPGRDTLQ